MSLQDFVCPIPKLTSITQDPCSVYFQNVQMMIFQKKLSSNNFVSGTNAISLAASWAGLSAAVDATKIVAISFLRNVTFAENEFIEGSENWDGANTINAIKPQMVTAEIENCTSGQLAAILDLKGVSDHTDLGVFFADSTNKILCEEVTDSPSTKAGFAISRGTFAVSNPSREGTFGAKFKVKIQFYLKNNWFEKSSFVAAEDDFSFLDVIV